MAQKVQSSLSFRKNTPGRRMASIRQSAKYEGQLYSFQYTSYGPSPTKKRPNIDKQPLLLLAYKGTDKIWKAGNGRSYIYGFNLNYLEPHRRLEVVEALIEIFETKPGTSLTYQQLKDSLEIPVSLESRIFRKYDIRGSKLRKLKEVDLDTYVAYLRSSLKTRD